IFGWPRYIQSVLTQILSLSIASTTQTCRRTTARCCAGRLKCTAAKNISPSRIPARPRPGVEDDPSGENITANRSFSAQEKLGLGLATGYTLSESFLTLRLCRRGPQRAR